MTFNWQSSIPLTAEQINEFTHIEYQFRKDIIKFLISSQLKTCCDDFSCYVFDFYPGTNNVEVSKEIPEPDYTFLKKYLSSQKKTVFERRRKVYQKSIVKTPIDFDITKSID